MAPPIGIGGGGGNGLGVPPSGAPGLGAGPIESEPRDDNNGGGSTYQDEQADGAQQFSGTGGAEGEDPFGAGYQAARDGDGSGTGEEVQEFENQDAASQAARQQQERLRQIEEARLLQEQEAARQRRLAAAAEERRRREEEGGQEQFGVPQVPAPRLLMERGGAEADFSPGGAQSGIAPPEEFEEADLDPTNPIGLGISVGRSFTGLNPLANPRSTLGSFGAKMRDLLPSLAVVGKAALITDNEQTYGLGAPPVQADKLRLQEYALWPAWGSDEAVPDTAPTFLQREDIPRLGFNATRAQGFERFYTKPRVHEILFEEGRANEEAEFYEFNQFFELRINIADLEHHYGKLVLGGSENTTGEETTVLRPGDINNAGRNLDTDAGGTLPGLQTVLDEVYGLRLPPEMPDLDNVDVLRLPQIMERVYTAFDRSTFVDHTMQLSLFMSERELENAPAMTNPLVATVKPTYNYLLLDYERALEQEVKRVRAGNSIPNMYTLLLESENREQRAQRSGMPFADPRTNIDFLNFTTLGGLIPTVRPVIVSGQSAHSRKQYFCFWTNGIKKLINDEVDEYRDEYLSWRSSVTNFGNILVPSSQIEFIKRANEFKNSFPMHVGLQFPAHGLKNFSDMFKDGNLMTFLMREAIRAPEAPFNSYTRTFTSPEDISWGHTNSQLNPLNLKTLDIIDFWKDFSNGSDFDPRGDYAAQQQKLLDDHRAIILGSNDEDDSLLSQKMGAIATRRLQANTFKGKLRESIINNMRTYEDLINQRIAKSETVFYRVEKYLNGRLVQEYYLPNDSKIDVLDYIDTQVMYGKSLTAQDRNIYTYKIYAAQMVIGSEYSLWRVKSSKNPGIGFNDGFYANELGIDDRSRWNIRAEEESAIMMQFGQAPAFKKYTHILVPCFANVKPSVKLVHVPVFDSGDVTILDKPPAPPEANFVPYKNVDNKLLINMTEQANTLTKQKVTIINQATDGQEAQMLLMSQLATGAITVEEYREQIAVYGNDDYPASFEVFRTETPPTSYSDFTGKLHYVADLLDDRGNPLASASDLRDTLEPNRKYYYTIRVTDIHGHTSNPTPVYEVQLVNEAGAVYLLNNIYDFPEETTKNFTKDVRKYLKISPALIQTLVDLEGSALVDGGGNPTATATGSRVKLGLADQAVWGKKYKLRLTSKKTGRRIDVNVIFNKSQLDAAYISSGLNEGPKSSGSGNGTPRGGGQGIPC